jgi:hypothetical protein
MIRTQIESPIVAYQRDKRKEQEGTQDQNTHCSHYPAPVLGVVKGEERSEGNQGTVYTFTQPQGHDEERRDQIDVGISG